MNWTKESYKQYKNELFSNGDESYRLFHEKLLCSSLPVVGLRIPFLRNEAKKIAKESGEDFLAFCGTDTYEERLLYGLVTAALPISFETFLSYCDHYTNNLIENWAHCDVFCSSLKKMAAKQEELLFVHAKEYLLSSNPWVVRTGIVILMSYYLKEAYFMQALDAVGAVSLDFYYVEMGQAWFLATAWAKDAHAMRQHLDKLILSDSVKVKFVQKARESYRVSPEDKAWLKEWKKGY